MSKHVNEKYRKVLWLIFSIYKCLIEEQKDILCTFVPSYKFIRNHLKNI